MPNLLKGIERPLLADAVEKLVTFFEPMRPFYLNWPYFFLHQMKFPSNTV
jgi:hypothetical protein